MDSRVIHYFTSGNTAKGFYSLLDTNMQGVERLFILQSGSMSARKECFDMLEKMAGQQGMDLEILHCIYEPASVEGIIFPKEGAAVVANSIAGLEEAVGRAGLVKYVKCSEREELMEDPETYRKMEIARMNACTCFQQALAIHDEWENIYINRLIKEKANELAKDLIDLLIPENMESETSPIVKHRFLGAATPEGAVDFVPNLTEELSKKYYIKGRPGTGKSTMLRKIAAIAEERGYDTEIYHCGLDPNSLDMVIVRHLGFAIFDSTAPHEYFPENSSDEIIDVYEKAVEPGTDEEYETELQAIAKRYREKMEKGTAFLQDAKQWKEKLEQLNDTPVNESLCKELCQSVLEELK